MIQWTMNQRRFICQDFTFDINAIHFTLKNPIDFDETKRYETKQN